MTFNFQKVPRILSVVEKGCKLKKAVIVTAHTPKL